MLKDLRILLVEDDDVDAEVVERVLAKSGKEIPFVRARDGIEGLEAVRGEGKFAGAPTPNLILLDLNMPRKSGLEFLWDLRDDPNHWKTSVYILTTSNDEKDRAAAARVVVDGYIVKSDLSEDFSELLNLVGPLSESD